MYIQKVKPFVKFVRNYSIYYDLDPKTGFIHRMFKKNKNKIEIIEKITCELWN